MAIKLSVSITAYNHGPFVAQALDSVLAQRTSFPYEILVGEDNSSDDTRAIVQDYAVRYPDRIRLFLHDRSQVIFIDGKPSGRWNLVNNLRQAQGQYVAWLDGDDYWTSADKLQRQVDYLDAHPECALCFHAVTNQDDEGQNSLSLPPEKRERYTLDDLLLGNFIAACSVVYRNGLFDDFPDWYFQAPMGDWPLHVLNAQHGDLAYIDQVMAVHRVHGGSIWSATGSAARRQRVVAMLETLRDALPAAYTERLNQSIAVWQLKTINSHRIERHYQDAVRHALNLLVAPNVPRRTLLGAALYGVTRSGH
jgi:glycosyltransferase involved in cell wall biosynthesis